MTNDEMRNVRISCNGRIWRIDAVEDMVDGRLLSVLMELVDAKPEDEHMLWAVLKVNREDIHPVQ